MCLKKKKTTCVVKLFGFLGATAMLHAEFATFDAHVVSTFLHLLTPSGFECSQERMDRAKLKASLPSPYGCGLFKTFDQASISWWASVASCLYPTVFDFLLPSV